MLGLTDTGGELEAVLLGSVAGVFFWRDLKANFFFGSSWSCVVLTSDCS